MVPACLALPCLVSSSCLLADLLACWMLPWFLPFSFLLLSWEEEGWLLAFVFVLLLVVLVVLLLVIFSFSGSKNGNY